VAADRRALIVIGTRPEAIKLAPVIRALRAARQLVPIVGATGQHGALAQDALALFGLKADHDLKLETRDPSAAGTVSAAMAVLATTIREVQPSVVVVQGDTASAFAGALAAFYAGVPVAHVEAGLRSRNLGAPFPEEGQRQLISRLASVHFAPTDSARESLMHEGVSPRDVPLTGNTGIDALLTMTRLLDHSPMMRARMRRRFAFLPGGRRIVLVTAHRRESLGQPLEKICAGLRLLAERADVEIVFPVHPNPAVSQTVRRALSGVPGIHLTDPLDYAECVWLLRRCDLVITDSGGLQEEAPTLGKPLLVLRDVTERPEGIEAGVAALTGTDPVRIAGSALAVLRDPAVHAWMSRPLPLYGGGGAAKLVARMLGLRFGRPAGQRAPHREVEAVAA